MIKNYTTQISALKSIGEIQGKLIARGARSILLNYDENKEPESISFITPTKQGEIAFRLPANVSAVERLLFLARDPSYRRGDTRYQEGINIKLHAQAIKTAWRIIKDWIDAQMAIIETEMVTLEQVFLPYMLVGDKQATLYEVMQSRGFLLTEGRG